MKPRVRVDPLDQRRLGDGCEDHEPAAAVRVALKLDFEHASERPGPADALWRDRPRGRSMQ